MKAPHFFIYAKGKSPSQVEQINLSTVNRLDSIIPNKRMSFTVRNIGRFNHKDLMTQLSTTIDPAVIEFYDAVEKQYRYSVNFYDNDSNCAYLRDIILHLFTDEFDYSLPLICDMLIKHLFCKKRSKRKGVFWMCFGDIVLENLLQNLPPNSIQCKKCGVRFTPVSTHQKTCSDCSRYQPIGMKNISCIDCGTAVEIDSKNTKTVRCCHCQKKHASCVKSKINAKYYRNHTN